MKLKLFSATALGLVLATAAYADSNEAYITQSGDSNSAGITQGSGATTGNKAGRLGDPMSQSGNNNVLTILQEGDAGKIGVKSGTDSYITPDSTPNPQFTITYQGVEQTSSGAGSNTASLTQDGTGAEIGELRQTASGSAGGNSTTTDQTGANTLNHIWQTQQAGAVNNVIDVTQTGTGNVVDRIDQKASGTGAAANQITVTMSGTDNGTMDLSGTAPFYTSRAWAMGATQSALIQNNYGNTNGVAVPGTVSGNIIDLNVAGSGNQFGLTQKGSDNVAGFGSQVSLTGADNTFGSYQAGEGNVITGVTIEGDRNDVGIWQIGSTNTATVSMISVGSDDNGLSIAQQGTSNTATVSITGSGNGDASFASGSTAKALVDANPATMFGGTIVQGSSLSSTTNMASLTVFGNDNAFAISSLGSNNTVTGTIGTAASDSSNNSAAVVQNGSSNTASFSQTGSGSNSVSISQ